MADALAEILDQGPPPEGVGPVPQLALVPPEPVFQQAPPAEPLFKPAPAAPPLPVPVPAAAPPAPVSGVTPPFEGPPDPDAPAKALDQQALDVAQQEGAQNVTTAQVGADNADRQAKQAEATVQVKRRAIERGVQYVDQAMTNWRTKVEAFEKAPIESYWADKTTGDKVVAGIALAFGALGAGLTGFAGKSTGNLAAAQLERNIDAHFTRERERIMRLKDSVAMARTGLDDARKAKDELLDDTDAIETAAWKAVEMRGIASLKAQGVPAAEIAGHKTIVYAQQKQIEATATKLRQREQDAIAAEKHRRQTELMAAQTAKLNREAQAKGKGGKGGKPGAGGSSLRVYGADGTWTGEMAATKEEAKRRSDFNRTVGAEGRKPESAGKAPTEAQAKLAMFGNDMNTALDRIENLGEVGAATLAKVQNKATAYQAAESSAASGTLGNLATRAGRSVGLVPRSPYEGLDEREAKILNDWNVAKEAYMRLISGAAIGNEEERRLALNAVPSAGDPPAIIRQKMADMRRRARNALALSGPAAGVVAAPKAGAPRPETIEQIIAPDKGRRGTVAGRPAIIYPDKTFEFIGAK